MSQQGMITTDVLVGKAAGDEVNQALVTSELGEHENVSAGVSCDNLVHSDSVKVQSAYETIELDVVMAWELRIMKRSKQDVIDSAYQQ